MKKRIGVIDTTLRDAHQCLWATRMTTPMMLPVAAAFDRAGFDQVDLAGTIQFDVATRYLKEDMWERVRLMRKRMPRTPLRSLVRSKNLMSFDVLPDDIIELWVEQLVANGFRVVGTFDGLNDVDNMLVSLRVARKLGAHVFGALAYSHSPVHTDEMYARTARELIERGGVHAIMIKDSSGLLTPDRIRTLVPALKAVIGDLPLELHGHCLTGLAPLVYLEGVKLGVDQVHLSVAPLADGAAQPPMQTVVANLRALGYDVDVDDGAVEEISAHFTEVARRFNKPLGAPLSYDAFHFEHQVPGGMQSNLQFQLEQAGLTDALPAVLHECARIRAELGWPIMITPFAQLVGTQAVLNVVGAQRYGIVPDEVKKYVLGYYGKLPAPVDPNVLDRIVANGSQKIALRPSDPAPAVDALRKRYPHAGDDERLLRFMFSGSQVDEMIAAGGRDLERRAEPQPILALIEGLAKRPEVRDFTLKSGTTYFEVHR